MIVDSLGRQFLVMHKHLIRISVIEEDLGITGKSLYNWVIGKRPLPDKWEKPLYAYLYPMLDPGNEIHQKTYWIDRVVVLEQHHILSRFKDVSRDQLRRFHFSEKYTAGAEVVYFRFNNRTLKESYIPIYSAYMKSSW